MLGEAERTGSAGLAKALEADSEPPFADIYGALGTLYLSVIKPCPWSLVSTRCLGL